MLENIVLVNFLGKYLEGTGERCNFALAFWDGGPAKAQTVRRGPEGRGASEKKVEKNIAKKFAGFK